MQYARKMAVYNGGVYLCSETEVIGDTDHLPAHGNILAESLSEVKSTHNPQTLKTECSRKH